MIFPQGDGFEHGYQEPSFMPMVNRDSPECMGKVGSGLMRAESLGIKSPKVCPEALYQMEPPLLCHKGGLMSITKTEAEQLPPRLEVEEKFEGDRNRESDQLEMHFYFHFLLYF